MGGGGGYRQGDRKLINTPETALPLDRPEVVGWYFDLIAENGFEMVQAMRIQPRKD